MMGKWKFQVCKVCGLQNDSVEDNLCVACKRAGRTPEPVIETKPVDPIDIPKFEEKEIEIGKTKMASKPKRRRKK